MQNRDKKALLIPLALFFILLIPHGSALEEANILIVRDGHVLSSEASADLPADKYLSRYINALEPLKNVSTEVYTTGESESGPSASYMKQFDAVIWYTLDDYGGNPVCDSCPTLTDQDRSNLTSYLKDYNGRLLLTGHRLKFDLSGTSFWQDILNAYNPNSLYYKYNKNSREAERVYLSSDPQINTVLRGESGDPVTNNMYFQPEIDTDIEPTLERSVFVDKCKDEYPLYDDYSKAYCNYAEDSLFWAHPNQNNVYLYDIDDDYDGRYEYWYLEERLHALVRTDKPAYRSILLGFGLESTQSPDNRRKLTEWSLNYLLGARPSETRIMDSERSDYPHYTNGSANLTAQCVNNQIQQGTEVNNARFFHSNSSAGLNPILNEGFNSDLTSWTVTTWDDGNDGNGSAFTWDCDPIEGEKTLALIKGGVNLTSSPLNLPNNSSILLEYYLKSGGDCYKSGPEEGEDLLFYYQNEAGDWIRLKRHQGDQVSQNWKKYSLTLPASEVHDNLKVRFNYPYADHLDIWLVDDFKVSWRLNTQNGSFDESVESVKEANLDATKVEADLSNYPEGINDTYAIQCQDNSPKEYWGPMQKDWIVIDIIPPNKPLDVRTERDYSNQSLSQVTVDHIVVEDGVTKSISKERRSDLVRFSCDQETWSDWREYDDTQQEQTYQIDIASSELGCKSSNGNKTIYVQGRDYAGNKAPVVSDWIVYDTYSSNLTGHEPANKSVIDSSDQIQVNSTDYKPPGVGTIAGLLGGNNHTFYNGQQNQNFTVNQSFDPDWSIGGTKTLTTFIYDRARNILESVFSFVLDLKPPQLDKMYAINGKTENNSVLAPDQSIHIEASDERSNISRLAVKGLSWHNFTVNSNSTTKEIDPAWTGQGQKTLTVWINDSVNHIYHQDYTFYHDTKPPQFLDFIPNNKSHIQSSKELEVSLYDKYAGLDSAVYNIDTRDNNSFNSDQSFSVEWSEGSHNITYWAKDTLGFYNRTVLNYIVDDTPPVIESIKPAADYINGTERVEIEVADSLSNIDTVSVYDGSWHNFTGQTTIELEPNWNTEDYHTLKIRVNDTAGNVNTTQESWKLDGTPPNFLKITPQNNSYINTSKDLKLDLEDPGLEDSSYSGAGLWKGIYRYSTNTSFEETDYISPGWTSSGTHSLQVWFQDLVNNTNYTRFQYKVDAEAPIIDKMSPRNNSYVQPEETILVTPADQGPDGGSGTDLLVFNNGTENTTLSPGNSYDPSWGSTTNAEEKIDLWINDTVGNLVYKLLSFKIDSESPSTSAKNVPSSWTDTDANIDLDAQDNFDVNYTEYCIYPSSESGCSLGNSGKPNITVSITCSVGDTCEKILPFRTNDSAGNWEAKQETGKIQIDKEKPYVEIQAPDNGSTKGGSISLLTDIHDHQGSGISDANYSIVNKSNLSDIEKQGDLSSSNNWDAEWDSSAITSGTFVFNITAEDQLSQVNKTNLTFYVDNGRPSVSIRSPIATYWQEKIEIETVAERSGEGTLKNHSVRIYNASSNLINETIETLSTSSNIIDYNYTFNSGDYILNTTAWDNSSQKAETSTSFIVDSTPPVIGFNSPSNESWQTGTVTINSSATDNYIKSCKWRYYNGTWSQNFTLSSCNTTFDFDTTNCKDSRGLGCKPQIWGQDQAGNLGSSFLAFKVDNSPPQITFNNPPAHSWHNNTFNVSHSESENTTLDSVDYKIGTGGWNPINPGTNITIEVPGDCGINGQDACNFTINATNEVNLSTVKTRKFSIDVYKPQIDYISWNNKSNLTSQDRIQIEFSDNVSNVIQSNYYNGSTITSFSSGDKIDPQWSLQGLNNLTITITDKAGNQIVVFYQYTLDNTPPLFLDIVPANNSDIRQDHELSISGYDLYTDIESSKFDNNEEGTNLSFTINESFSPQWDLEGNRQLDVYLKDYPGNLNHTRYEFVVDGSAPTMKLVSPNNNTVIELETNLTINASDKWLAVESNGTLENGEGDLIEFPVNQSFNPGWESEGSHQVIAKVNDSLNHTAEKNYKFVADNSSPRFNNYSLNISYARENDSIEIKANVSDRYSNVEAVVAKIRDSIDYVIDSKTLGRYGTTNIYNTTYSAPDLPSQTIEIKTTANDTLGFSATDNSSFYLDNQKPVLEDAFFNLSRPYREEPVGLKVNSSDDLKTVEVIATINSSFNSQQGENLSLEEKNGNWSKVLVKERTGIYNISRLYLKDQVGNRKTLQTNLPSFTVVNHSIEVKLNGDNFTQAGTREQANITLNFNRVIENPEVKIYLPPSQPDRLEEAVFNNITDINCSFGSSCNLKIGEVNDTISYLNFSGDGQGKKAFVIFEVRSPIPQMDENYTWTSLLKSNNREAVTEVKVPELKIVNLYCNGSLDCNVSQFERFDFTAEVINNQTENKTGKAFDVITSLQNSKLGINNESSPKSLSSVEKENFTFSLNISQAGVYQIGLQTYDNLTKNYKTSKDTKIAVEDVISPLISSTSLSNNLVTVGSTIDIYAEIIENQKVDNLTFELENKTTSFNLTEKEPETTGEEISRWKASYSNISQKASYNVTNIYVYDEAGNLNKSALNLSFEVTELKIKAKVNKTDLEVQDPVQILSNVTGNADPIEKVEANITKPLGNHELVNLTMDEESASDYTAIYRNTSQSGNYSINLTVTAGTTAFNSIENLSVNYGSPQVLPMEGEQGTIEVLTGDSYNVTWKIKAAHGGLEKVNSSVSIGNGSIATSSSVYKEVGNIFYREDYKLVNFVTTPAQIGTTVLNLTVDSLRGRQDSYAYNLSVKYSESTAPNITDYSDNPDLVNKHQVVWIKSNISDNSIVKNATVTVHHPENQSNYTEEPEKMEQVGNEFYRYKFTNTTEKGHYTYEVETWDVAGNKDKIISHSFNVTEEYTLDLPLDSEIYVKGDKLKFNVEATDARGDKVTDFNLNLTLNKNGTNQTLISNEKTNSYDYTIKTSDPPSETTSVLPKTYRIYAEASKAGNSGEIVKDFKVTRILEPELIKPEGPVQKGETFQLTLKWKEPSGSPIPANSVVYTRCSDCPSDYKLIEAQGDGLFSQSFQVKEDAEDSILLRLYAIDGQGNSESQESGRLSDPPLRSIEIGTNETLNQPSPGGGSGAGGMGMLNPIEIEMIKPADTLPPETKKGEIKLNTSRNASCQFSQESFEFGEGYPLQTDNGITHTGQIPVQKGKSYNLKVICKADNQTSKSAVAFYVAEKEIKKFVVKLDDQLKVVRGKTAKDVAEISNKGNLPLNVDIEVQNKSCCQLEITDQVRIKQGSRLSVPLSLHIPLNQTPDKYSAKLIFQSGEVRKERSVELIVAQNQNVADYLDLKRELNKTLKEIEEFSKSGVDVSNLRNRVDEINKDIYEMEKAISADNLTKFKMHLSQAKQAHNNVESSLLSLKFEKFIYENWWKILITLIAIYIAFYMITMIGIPYLRLKREVASYKKEEQRHTNSRKKAERQYFKREIDRDTFMNIMTERQDKVLEVRGKKDEAERNLEHLLEENISLKTFVRAPYKALFEIHEWIKAKRREREIEEKKKDILN